MTAVHLLVVEDEPAIQAGLCDRLQREGFRVDVAGSLAAARELLANRPDLVVLDRRLPDGDGLQLLQDLRAS